MYELIQSKKKALSNLYAERIGLNQEFTWYDAQKQLQSDNRFKEVQAADREILFNDYIADLQERIIGEFTRFLNETTIINKDTPTEGPLFKEAINKLNQDIRCQRMYKQPDKRDKLVRARIKSLKFNFDKQQREQRTTSSNKYINDNTRENKNK
jgi:hypothetical protein